MYLIHDLYFKTSRPESTAIYHEWRALTQGEFLEEKKGVESGMKKEKNSGRCVHRGRGPCHLTMSWITSGALSSNDTTRRQMEEQLNRSQAADMVSAHLHIFPWSTTSVIFTFWRQLHLMSTSPSSQKPEWFSMCCVSMDSKPHSIVFSFLNILSAKLNKVKKRMIVKRYSRGPDHYNTLDATY